MSDLCDFCKKEKDEVFHKEIINFSGETVDVFLCLDCYNKKSDDIDLIKLYEKNKEDLNIRLLYSEVKRISDKLSKIISLLDNSD